MWQIVAGNVLVALRIVRWLVYEILKGKFLILRLLFQIIKTELSSYFFTIK